MRVCTNYVSRSRIHEFMQYSLTLFFRLERRTYWFFIMGDFSLIYFLCYPLKTRFEIEKNCPIETNDVSITYPIRRRWFNWEIILSHLPVFLGRILKKIKSQKLFSTAGKHFWPMKFCFLLTYFFDNLQMRFIMLFCASIFHTYCSYGYELWLVQLAFES